MFPLRHTLLRGVVAHSGIRIYAKNLCSQAKLLEYKDLITDSETEEKLKLVLKVCDEYKAMSKKVPSRITADEMQDLMSMKYWECIRYLRKLWVVERTMAQEAEREQQHQREVARLAFIKDNPSAIFDPHLVQESLQRWYTHRLCTAAMFGQPLVFDFGFDEEMGSNEIIVAVKNMEFMHKYNMEHSDPFDLHLCNVNDEMQTSKILQFCMSHLRDASRVLQFERKSYMDLFPKERLVYLSPNAEDTMMEYDHNAVYIIGMLVELEDKQPLSFLKAQKEGIRTAKLPLEQFCHLDSEKCLRMRQVLSILLDVKVSGNWELAFETAFSSTVFKQT